MPTPVPASTPRPTLEQIRQWVAACGGTLSNLAYEMPVMGIAGEGGKPQRITVVQVGGMWGQHWWQVGQDVRYHLLEFEDDVRGEGNSRALPDNWQIRIPPTGPNAAKRFRDEIFTGDPQFTVEFPGIRDSKRRSELEQQWSSYIDGEIQRMEQVAAQSPLDEAKQHLVDYGITALYDVLDLARWPERPKRRRSEPQESFNVRMDEYETARRAISPFVTRVIHPLNFACDMSTSPPRWFMVREPIFAWDAADRFPAWSNAAPGQPPVPAPGATPQVKTEWWTDDWRATYIQGKPALGAADGADTEGVARNPYGHIPIVIAAGGQGEADVANRPEVVFQGLIRKIRHILLEDALIFNLTMVYQRRVSFGPKMVVFAPEGQLDQPRMQALMSELQGGPSVIARAPTEWRIQDLQPPQIPPEILQRRQELREDIQSSTTYDVSAGAPQGGPAYKMQLQLAQSSKRVGLDVLHLQQAMEQWARHRLFALKRMLKDEKVGANFAKRGEAPHWVDLDPATIPDQIEVTCKLTSDSETEKARKQESGMALYAQQLISPVDLWREYMDDPKPEEKVASWIAWQMTQQVTIPALIQAAQGGLMQMLGQWAQAQGLAQAQQGGGGMMDMSALGGAAPAAGGPVGAPGMAAASPPGSQQPGQPVQTPQGGGGLQVGPQGAMLPNEPLNQQLDQMLNPPSPNTNGRNQRAFPNIVGQP